MFLKQKLVNYFTVLTSAGTLICCALPATMVAFGFGAALMGLVTEVPQLIWLSEHKLWIFGIGALMLSLGGYLQWQAQFLPCPIDPEVAKACDQTRKTSLRIYFFSLAVYVVGFLVSFVMPYFV